jgi:CubicO group peptidase (beta-lactamase class C family)
MNLDLDWPVDRAGLAVVSPSGTERAALGGVGGGDEFAVASVTKLMTTLAALTAIEGGRLDLDQPVPEAGDGVTVRHLLAHASGLPFEHSGGRRAPGTRRIYSNVGFRLLGETVADAVGTVFGSWMGASVLAPLGMSATRLGSRRGFEEDPAAGAVSTLDDLERLARCLLDRGAPVVGRELFDEAASVQFPGLAGLVPGVGRFDPCDWGLGFELHDGKRPHWMGDRRSAAAFGHFGASGCFLWVDPEAELACAAVSDRAFDDGRWAMATWPAWCDRLPSA